MSRIVVNVATDSWVRGQVRLTQAMLQFGQRVLPWSNCLPPGCPPHRTAGLLAGLADQCRPYAFKAYALQEAVKQGHATLLWCDASIVPIRSLTPLWERIERDGYWISRNGWDNSEWTADSAYPDLFPGVPIEEARAINKMIPHVVGTAFGIDVNHAIGKRFLHEYFRLASTTRAFCGPWQNSDAPRVAQRNEDRPAAPCGPPTTLGHRHDQTAASVIAWRLEMQLTDGPSVFSYTQQRNADGRPALDPGLYRDDTILLAAGI